MPKSNYGEIAGSFLVWVALYWAGNAGVSLWDRDEPRYADTARTMLRTGDFIVPYFNEEFRFQKPVLTYWIVAASYQVFGDSEFAARAPMGLSVALACAVVWLLGDRMYGAPAGRFAAWMLALCPLSAFLGKLTLPDGPHFLAATLVMATLWLTWRREDAPRWAAPLFWTALAGTVLIKGPIVIGGLAAAMVVLFALCRSRPSDFRLYWWKGGILFAALVTPWLVAIYQITDGAFFRESLGRQVLDRARESFDGRFHPPGYYLATSLIGFAPWIGFMCLALYRDWRKLREPGPLSFLLAWCVGPLVVMELFRSKQIHYYAPAYPAMALIAGGHLAALLRGARQWRWDIGGKAAVGWYAGLSLALLSASLVVGWHVRSGFGWVAAGAVVFILAFLIALRSLAGLRFGRFLAVAGAGQGALVLALAAGMAPAMEAERTCRPLGEYLATVSRRDRIPVDNFRVGEPSMTYYARRGFTDFWTRPENAAAIKNADRDRLCAVLDEDLERLQKTFPGRCTTEKTFQGWYRMHRDVVHVVRIAPSPAMIAARSRP